MRKNLRKAYLSAAAATTALVTTAASAQVTLPDTGVDTVGSVTAAITAIGAVAVAVVGGYFAFLVVRKGMQWGRKALG